MNSILWPAVPRDDVALILSRVNAHLVPELVEVAW